MNLGQIYTKDIVADFMVSLFSIAHHSIVIDPCFGGGVFIKSLTKAGFNNITAIEIDPESYNKYLPAPAGTTLLNQDFFAFEPNFEIDGIIMNPPYVRQEEIDDMDLLGVTKEFIKGQCDGFRIYAKANLYIYFIARAIKLLRKGGELVAIFPNAWLNTPDGNDFLNQIKSKGNIDNLIDVKGYPFIGNPLVDVMILKFTKGGEGNTIKQNLIVDEDIHLIENLSDTTFVPDKCIPLNQIAFIRRGVTTGYNDCFINPEIDLYNKSILSTPKDVVGYNTDSARLDRILIIKESNLDNPEVSKYIKECEYKIKEMGKPKTLLTYINNGKPWYVIRLPEPSQIIFPYIIRENIRFIYNSKNVIVRDNFYTIYFDGNPFVLMALLNNYYIYSQLENFGKSYGNGLLKIQKYDIDKLSIPNPDMISHSKTNKLIELSKQLIETGNPDYIKMITHELSDFYGDFDIKQIYSSQKRNRLNYEK